MARSAEIAIGYGRLLAITTAIVCPAAPSLAQARPPANNICRLELLGTGKVSAISDGRSFFLDDGREIRLPGIEVPPPPRPGEAGTRAQAGGAARAALEAILAGESVELRQGRPMTDRYGRILAHAYVMREGWRQSAAYEMLAAGFARVSAEADCAAELLAREQTARNAKLGLWGQAYYALIPASNLGQLAAERGHFTVVEGRVLSVRENAGTIYMNFGRRWSEALTVTILKRNERIFVAAGLDPHRLANLRVRVRGFIEERNGPRIEAMRPEQIEIAER
jgi:endonuclease YncB( thermonuclease family)